MKKNKILNMGLIALSPLVLSACIPESLFATDPVIVPTNYGNVHCQLYSKDINWWDRSISHPRGMTQEAADQLCFDVGAGKTNSAIIASN